MEVRDSRRLTGPNLVSSGPAAVLDVTVEAQADPALAAAAWQRHLEPMLGALGWDSAEIFVRIFPGGMSLAFSAPLDALYAATEVNEWAWEAAMRELGGEEVPDFAAAGERLRAAVTAEANPPLRALWAAAAAHGVACLCDDELVSVGLGSGAWSSPVSAVPDPAALDWSAIHDVPVALITGTNGKTTTVRLLATMIKAAGLTPGVSSTDWIAVGDELLDKGDYAGPGGARQVLRDRRVECALLETARGGMLRRGLALARTEVAAITNVAADHLGEFGVHDIDALAECKFVVARAARRLVLNADDPVVRRHATRCAQPITWFTVDAGDPFVAAHLAAGGAACLLERGRLVWRQGDTRAALAEVAEVPIALGGAARYNIANALAAIGVAYEMGVEARDIGEGLRSFESTPESNPGRLNEFAIGGARFILDFAHNPHGVEALLDMAAALPARRRLVTIGQAGDRDDEALRQLAAATWKGRPDRILIKEMTEYLRGRAAGEVPRLLEAELRRLGASDEMLVHSGSELETAQAALAWAEPGDLILLLTHSHRDQVTAFLRQAAGERAEG
jgi:UDP-N-acetylmuramyl tripeptide synthase